MLLPINIDNLSSYFKPPLGYRFDKGLSTTYSLNLDILLSIPMFLDGALSEKYAVLENYQAVVFMIEKIRKRFKVYVQKGEIKTSPQATKKASKLYELLRDMIEEIPRDTAKSSFHPKLWLLKYVTYNGESVYKLIILSKNLTNSKDLDIAIVFDGEKVEEAHKDKNNKIYNFVSKTLNDNRFTKDELENIRWQNVDDFELEDILFFSPSNDELENIPFLQNRYLDKDMIVFSPSNDELENIPFLQNRYLDKDMIVFSPFLSNNIFAKNNKNILVTREDEIDEQICQDIYKVNESLYDEDYEDEVLELFEKDKDAKVKNLINQLHAKIYIYTKNRKNWLAFGSLNATNRGFTKNDEVLIILKAPKDFYNQTKKYIENEKRKIFVKANVIKSKDELEKIEKKQKVLDKIDKLKNTFLQNSDILKVNYKDKKLKANIKSIELNSILMQISPVSKVDFKQYSSKLEWNVIESEITGWFRFLLTLDGYSREFLVEDKEFQIDDVYKKAIEKEAMDKSQEYFEANIFALLSDGNISFSNLVKEHGLESDDTSHCYSSTIDDDIVDLMLDRYATSKEVYKSVYKLLSQNKIYKNIIDVLPEV